VLDVPDDGPVLLAPVVAGTLPLVGVNEHGVAVGAMSLSARDERVGIPRALVGRDVLDARDAADATARAMRPGRAGGYSYQFAFSDGGSLVVETTGSRGSVMATNAHTNHAIDPSVAEVTFPPSSGSQSRLSRASSSPDRGADDGRRRRDLADHDGPGSICAHRIPPTEMKGRRSCCHGRRAGPALADHRVRPRVHRHVQTFELDDLR
jgi:hypothetical protein